MTDADVFAEDLLVLCRAFGVFERDSICCGTVTVPQCVVMQLLLPTPLEVSVLASRTGVSNGAMTRLVDGLERRDFAHRVRSTWDRRRVSVELTDAGCAEAQRLRGLTRTAIASMLDGIPPDKRDQVVEAMGLVRRSVEQARDAFTRCCG